MSYQSITTLATTDPAQGSAQLTMGSGTSCLVIDTGPGDLTEPYFFLYVRLGSGTVKKIKTYRYTRHVIPTTEGATVAIGSDSARSITVIQYSLPSLATPTGWETATSVTDEAEPRVWIPQSRHIATATVKKIIVLPEVSGWKDIWISDYDGANWSPARWIRTHPTYTPNGVTVPVFGVGVALCTQDGATVQVKLSADANVQGQSYVYELDMPSVTNQVTVTANDGADFLTKLQAATSGTELIVPAGTYTIASQITHHDWAQGVTISGPEGDGSDVILEFANTDYGVYLQPISWTQNRGARNFTFPVDSTHGAFRAQNAGLRLSNIHAIGDKTRNVQLFSLGNSGADIKCHRCTAYGSGDDGWSGIGGPTDVYLIDCEGGDGGPDLSDQALTSHNDGRMFVLGGYYRDAQTNLIAPDNTARIDIEFATFEAVSRSSGVTGAGTFGCRSPRFTTRLAQGTSPSNYCMFFLMYSTVAGVGLIRNYYADFESNWIEGFTGDRIIHNDSPTDFAFRHCVFRNLPNDSTNSAIWHSGGTGGSNNHDFMSFTGQLIGRFFQAPTNANKLMRVRNVAVRETTGLGAMTGSGSLESALVQTDYGVWSAVSGASWPDSDNVGENDIVSVEAQLETTLIPTASGNCDNTGDPALYDWIGGRGPTVQPLIYDLGVTSRGALTRPQSGEIFPDAWNAEAVQSSTEQDPDPGEGEAPVENVYIARASVRGRQVTAVWQLANTGQSVNGSASNPEINIVNFAGTSITGGRVAMTIENGAFKYEHPTSIIGNNQTYLALFYATIAGEERVFPQTLP